MAGPATVAASVTVPLTFVTMAYTVPAKSDGSVTWLFLMGREIVDRPVKSDKKSPDVLPEKVSVTTAPATGAAGAMVNPGKALNGSTGFDEGQLVMKAEARVVTWLKSSGTSKGPDQGVSWLTADATQAACLASVLRIEPAVSRFSLLVINWAAPRYALVPTPSKIWDNAVNDFKSV